MSVIDKLLKGSIDLHLHPSPDATRERRVDALQAAVQARDAGMRAIVLKSHEYPTAPLAWAVSQAVPGISVFGAISLDEEVGGLNPHALTISAKLGAKLCWMPTTTSANDRKKKGLPGGLTIFDAKGKLLPVVGELLDIIKSYRMVLCTGHLSGAEVFALVDEAVRRGLTRIIITHPLLEQVGAHLSVEEQRRLADKGAFVEHCFNDCMPLRRTDPLVIVNAVKAVGAERTVLSTDLGQAVNPAPAEGFRVMIATMLACGLSEGQIEVMVKTNPARLLDLD